MLYYTILKYTILYYTGPCSDFTYNVYVAFGGSMLDSAGRLHSAMVLQSIPWAADMNP